MTLNFTFQRYFCIFSLFKILSDAKNVIAVNANKRCIFVGINGIKVELLKIHVSCLKLGNTCSCSNLTLANYSNFVTNLFNNIDNGQEVFT